MIFLSGGEINVRNNAMYDLCRDAVGLGSVDLKLNVISRLTNGMLGGRFRSTRSHSDRIRRHLRCVRWHRSH